MALFVLHRLILPTCMRNHPVELAVWFLVWPFVYFHTSWVRRAKALARLRGCAGSPEPSLVAYVISMIISWAGLINIIFINFTKICNSKLRIEDFLQLDSVFIFYLSPVKRNCVFEHSVMTNFNCACPAIQRGQGSCFLSEGSSWLTACMSEQRRFWPYRLNVRCSHRR